MVVLIDVAKLKPNTAEFRKDGDTYEFEFTENSAGRGADGFVISLLTKEHLEFIHEAVEIALRRKP